MAEKTVVIVTDPVPFSEGDAGAKERRKFYGIINKRYLKAVEGAFHGITSLLAFILGNVFFIIHSALGYDRSSTLDVRLSMYAFTVISAAIVYFFYWDQVQVRLLLWMGLCFKARDASKYCSLQNILPYKYFSNIFFAPFCYIY